MKDRLTAWNGKSFAYDSCGNPTKYKGDSMSWQRGRLLSSYTKGGKTYTFNYDINGIRRKKTAGTDSTEYLISDGKLIQQNNYTSGSSTPASKIVFLYSNDGITGCVINNWVYKYEKDISGNVVSLLSGTFQVARYEYDAWGNCKVLNPNGTENTSATFAGNINPIRYRSYYYDSDIGLYYLQTRYYDPETGRFINLDQIEYIDPEQLNGLNLYAYCLNNPVMGYDPDGTFSWGKFLAGVIVVALIAVAVVATAGAAAIPAGMAGATIATTALELTAAAAIGASVSGAISISTQSDEDFSFKQFGSDIGIGALSGMFSYGAGKVLGGFGEQIGFSLSNSYLGGNKIGNFISGKTLGTLGKIAGSFIGGFGGGMFFDDTINGNLGNGNYLGERIKNNIFGDFLSRLVGLFS